MKIVCIVGKMGAGKTQLGKFLSKRGEVVINFDKISRRVLQEKKNDVIKILGNEILDNDNNINFMKVKELAFADKNVLQNISNLSIYKIIFYGIKEIIMKILQGNRVIYIETPLFYKYKLYKYFYYILVVSEYETRRARLLERYSGKLLDDAMNLGDNYITHHIRPDFIVYNKGNLENLEAQANSIRIKGNSLYHYLIVFILFGSIAIKFLR
ncbi:Dephospho-CoA kinase [Spraguea lophii 42_110]|uniref:Dephospho-CoA kinase n=1 Tax=Spraguea lophii (strain 42_110) TaxID=1358809 RepID=S7W6B8_SPRLO|nr:Dephospho-CoA kinase [Spraguea lophii 42_110]